MEKVTTKRENGSRRVSLKLSKESTVEQTHKKDTSINNIIKNFKRTGLLPQPSQPGFYGDFTNATDFHTAKNCVLDAEADFNSLPSHIRKRFHNDPAELLTFIHDDRNIAEAVLLGILPEDYESPETEPIVEPDPPETPPAEPSEPE